VTAAGPIPKAVVRLTTVDDRIAASDKGIIIAAQRDVVLASPLFDSPGSGGRDAAKLISPDSTLCALATLYSVTIAASEAVVAANRSARTVAAIVDTSTKRVYLALNFGILQR
jgi:hypothetical protein